MSICGSSSRLEYDAWVCVLTTSREVRLFLGAHRKPSFQLATRRGVAATEAGNAAGLREARCPGGQPKKSARNQVGQRPVAPAVLQIAEAVLHAACVDQGNAEFLMGSYVFPDPLFFFST